MRWISIDLTIYASFRDQGENAVKAFRNCDIIVRT